MYVCEYVYMIYEVYNVWRGPVYKNYAPLCHCMGKMSQQKQTKWYMKNFIGKSRMISHSY